MILINLHFIWGRFLVIEEDWPLLSFLTGDASHNALVRGEP